MDIIKTTALITINETLWVQIIIFLIFLFLINRIMFRPVRRNMAEREAHFSHLREAIDALKEEMGTLLKETEAEEKHLRKAAHRMGEELRQAGRKEAKRLLEQALDDVKNQHQEAEKQLKASMAVARRQIEAESSLLTVAIIQHLLNEEART